MRNLLVGSIVGLTLGACAPNTTQEAKEGVRMPYNQQVFFLDNEGSKSYLYMMEYDFQGLLGDAVLTPIWPLDGRSHMAISPNKRWVVIVNNAQQGWIHLVSTEATRLGPISIKLERLRDGVPAGKLALTQADFDEAGRLFLAGNNGVFLVGAKPGEENFPVALAGEDGAFDSVNAFTQPFDDLIDKLLAEVPQIGERVSSMSSEEIESRAIGVLQDLAAPGVDFAFTSFDSDGNEVIHPLPSDFECMDPAFCEVNPGTRRLSEGLRMPTFTMYGHEIPQINCGSIFSEEKAACQEDFADDNAAKADCIADAKADRNACKANGTLSKFKFKGGDLLFTQGSYETEGMEMQSAISLTRHKSRAAKIDIQYADSSQEEIIGAKYQTLFKLKKNVTGGAIMGDDHVIASYSNSDRFTLYDMEGNILAEPRMCVRLPSELVDTDGQVIDIWDGTLQSKLGLDGEEMESCGENENGQMVMLYPKSAFHVAGDLASTQSFDTRNGYDLDTLEGRRIEGDRSDLLDPGADLAEVALYRPGPGVADRYDVDDSDAPDVSDEARRNSANGDIADMRRNAMKFASLGKGGMMILDFDSEMELTMDSVLNVMETSWNKAASYDDPADALSAYHEKATVWVWHKGTDESQPTSVAAFMDGSGDIDPEANLDGPGGHWVEVGNAYISHNKLDLGDLVENDDLTSLKWILIRDGVDGENSRTPDGFDVNYVALADDANAFCSNPLGADQVSIEGLSSGGLVHLEPVDRCTVRVSFDSDNYPFWNDDSGISGSSLTLEQLRAGGVEFWYEQMYDGTAEKNGWGRGFFRFDEIDDLTTPMNKVYTDDFGTTGDSDFLWFRENLSDADWDTSTVPTWSTSFDEEAGDMGERRVWLRSKCSQDSWKMSDWVRVELTLPADTASCPGGVTIDVDG